MRDTDMTREKLVEELDALREQVPWRRRRLRGRSQLVRYGTLSGG